MEREKVNVTMLANAAGPHMILLAGKTYKVPEKLGKDLCSVRNATTEDVVKVDGKESRTTRVIGSVGPFARPAAPGEKLSNIFRPDLEDQEWDDE